MVATKDTRWQLPIMQFATLVGVMLLLMAVGSFAKTMLDNYRLADERARWESLLAEQQAQHAALLTRREVALSDTRQRQLAHEMGLYAPNERPIVLVLPPEMRQPANDFTPTYREEVPYEPPYWQQWWELFFGEGS